MEKREITTRHWWLTPIILAIQEAEIRRIVVTSQPWASSLPQEPISKKKKITKMDWQSGPSSKSTCLASVRP
jgi:hypothetical protein